MWGMQKGKKRSNDMAEKKKNSLKTYEGGNNVPP